MCLLRSAEPWARVSARLLGAGNACKHRLVSGTEPTPCTWWLGGGLASDCLKRPAWPVTRTPSAVAIAEGQCCGPRLLRFKRKAFVITDAELRLIASAAIMGESSHPVNGYSTPAAIGIPSAL